MGTKQDLKSSLEELKKRLLKEMPRVRKEIKVYEEKLMKGTLTNNPSPGPQFNV